MIIKAKFFENIKKRVSIIKPWVSDYMCKTRLYKKNVSVSVFSFIKIKENEVQFKIQRGLNT